MNTISGNLNVTDPSVLSTNGAGSFGDNPFLGLLTTQLRNQTPFEPMDNDGFMQQVATFSSMEEQKELNENMLALLDYQGLLARMQGLSQGSALLGKEVSYVRDGQEAKGVVDSVYVSENGTLRLKIGEDDIEMGSVVSIRDPEGNSGGSGSGGNTGSGGTSGSGGTGGSGSTGSGSSGGSGGTSTPPPSTAP